MNNRILTAIIILLSLLGLSQRNAHAQHNAYGIDDDCYSIYRRAERTVGKNNFFPILDSLIAKSHSKSDTKSETLAYVLNLKHMCVTGTYDDVVTATNKVKQIAENAGYIQYYFYAYEQLATYVFNKSDNSRGIEVAVEMIQDARDRENAYGEWSGNKFLAQIYIARLDYNSAKKYLKETIDIYNRSDDPTVGRQQIARQMCWLAELYGFESDSCKIYLDLAEKNAKSGDDSLLVYYGKARYSAVRNDYSSYTKYRGICMDSEAVMPQVSNDYSTVFSVTDNAFDGKWEKNEEVFQGDHVYKTLLYMSSLSRTFGKYKDASDLQAKMSDKMFGVMYKANTDKTMEAAATIGNLTLTRKLLKTTRRFLTITILLLVILAVVSIVYTKRLMKEMKRAENANMMKTRFVQNMSHEIRTPLNAIVGFSQLLGLPDGMLTEEEKNQYVKYITNNSEMLSMLVSDILDLSDNEHDNYRITIENFNVPDLCRNSITTVESRVPGGVELKFETNVPEDFCISSDPRRIQQVLTNYLTNACKHTEKGEIVLSCCLDENPGCMTFSVRDTGTGIPADKADEIFQRFTKLNSFAQGSGLGLNICSLIAQKLGAQAKLDTSYTGGARFLFILPLEKKS